MNFSDTALSILNNPMDYLDLDHSQKIAISPANIWSVKQPECSRDDFIKALNQIREVASRRGRRDGSKETVHRSIESYVVQVWDRFENANQLNTHLRGIFGCELPKFLRDRVFTFYVNKKVKASYTRLQKPSTPEPNSVTSEPVVESNSPLTFTFNGVSITLSSGASLNIGELETKALDFKGLKSVSIERVEGGKLYGVSLEA